MSGSDKKYTIKSLMKLVNEEKFCLPVIQRDFCWEPKYIELLFDSLMRDYPIGYFLLWKYNNDLLDKYSFYKFNCNVKKDENFINSTLQKHQAEGKIAILDGQQRIASMYIGLYGSYTVKKSGDNDDYIKKELYLDLFSNRKSDENLKVIEILYNFKFKTKDEITSENNSKNNYWFKISEVLSDSFNIDEIVKKIDDDNLKIIAKQNLNLLNYTVCTNDDLFIYKIIDKSKTIEEVLEMFERTNHLGKELSKRDLLFSSFVAQEPELRKNMLELINVCNKETGNKYVNKIDIDLIIQSCFLMKKETVKIRIDSIDNEMIKQIRGDWDKYKKPIVKFFELLNEIKIFPKTLNSIYAIYPVIYFIYKENKITEEIKNNIKKYILLSHLKRIYGTHSDTRVNQMVNAINEGKIKKFSYNELKKLTIDKVDNMFMVSETEIDTWLIRNKYNSNSEITLTILSLIQTDYDNVTNYDQDHLHPKNPKIEEIEKFSDNQLGVFKLLKNGIGNLQILKKGINRNEKTNMPLIEACNSKLIKVQFSSLKVEDYDIKKFEDFYVNRINNIKTKICKCFDIKSKKGIGIRRLINNNK